MGSNATIQGVGVVLVSHTLHDVFEVSERIVVLRLGRRVATFARAATTPEDVVAAITGARKESGRRTIWTYR